DDGSHFVGRRVGRPPRLAGDLAGFDRHQSALVRADLAHQFQQLRPRVPLDVEFHAVPERLQLGGDLTDVCGGDVPAVGAGMNRYSGNPGGHAHANGLEHGRNVAAPRVSERGHLVDIHAQVNHVGGTGFEPVTSTV